MVETIRHYISHTIVGIVIEGVPALIHSVNDIIHSIALKNLIQAAISIPLFYLHHNLFALGFAVGFIFDEHVKVIVKKVDVVFCANRTLIEIVFLTGGCGFLAILTVPTSMIAATLYYSSQWGALLYRDSLARQNQVQAKPLIQEINPIIQDIVIQ